MGHPPHTGSKGSQHLPLGTKFHKEFFWPFIAFHSGDFQASVVIKDVYLHFPIFPAHQHLHFAVGMRHWQFIALPFCQFTAPEVLTKVLALVFDLLRLQVISIIKYLHDPLFVRQQLAQTLSVSVQWTVLTLH